MCFVLKTLFFFSDCQLNGIIWPKRGARWRGGMEAWPSLGKSHTLVAEVNPTNDRPATTNGFRQDKTRVKVNFQLEFVNTTWVLGG